MQVEVNQKNIQLPPQATLGVLAEQLALQPAGTAVAVNNTLIPRAQWDTFSLSENDKIVVVQAACGG